MAPESKEVLLKLDQLKNEIKNTLFLEENLDGKLILTKKATSKTSSNKEFVKPPPPEESKIDKIRRNIVGFNTAYISPFNI